MEFTKRFTEAAQNAILRKIEADQWENMPWLAKLMQQVVRDGVAATVITSTDDGITVENLSREDVTNLSKVNKPVPYEFIEAARACGVDEHMLHQLAKVESAENKKPIGGTVVVAEEETGRARDSFESNDFAHVDGYDWRIIVADRMKNHHNSWAEHFNRRPTQEEFDYQFRHFHARTHHVHVNQWVDGAWITITEEYVPHWNKEKPAETFVATEEWPHMKTHRIKFWDQRVNAYNYVYFDRHPGGIVLHKYHTTKCYAVVQKRPEGV